MTESTIQKQIIDYCKAKNCIVMRMNSGARNYNVKLCPPGTPDLLIIRDYNNDEFSNVVWIEVKTEKGKVSKVQKEMHVELFARDQCVIVARCLDDVKGII
jgi:hypothetical protein